MMVTIYRGDKEELIKVPIGVGSKAKKELMTIDNITLVFSLNNALRLKIGDYIDDERYGLYILKEDYLPVYNNSTGGYDYKVSFDAYYYHWNNKLLKFNPEQGSSELTFSLTSTIDVHLSVVLQNITSLGYTYKGTPYSVEIAENLMSESKALSYQNVYIIDALNMIAEAYECEWWIEDSIIHLGKCYYESGNIFDIADNVTSMTPSSSSEDNGTRLYVYGSEKNLPSNYRQTEGVVNAIVQKRLMLPEGTPYIDSKTGQTNATSKEFVKVFENIFPKFDGVVSSVETYSDSVENEDGTISTETFYRFKDNGIKFSEEYLLQSDLSVKFSSGKLNGMEFGVTFNPAGVNEKNEDGTWNDEAQLFEIVTNENYGRKLPDSYLFPSKDDTYVLLNWDATKIAELGLVSKAEQELLTAGQKLLEDIDTDSKVYTCTLRSDYAKSLYNGTLRSLVNIGDSVTLLNDVYFPDSQYQSRVIGYEYNLDYPYDSPVYSVGNAPKYSRLSNVENDVANIKYDTEVGKTFNIGSSSVYVLSRKDKTPPSDKNVFSALRTQLDFLRRNAEGTAEEKILFQKGIEALLISYFESIIVRSSLSSPNYAEGISGYRLNYANGISELEVDKLSVRQIMTVVELLIQRLRSVGGQIIVSAADGKIKSIEENDTEYILQFEQENTYVENDLIRCQTFTGTNIKSYWVKVSYANSSIAVIDKTEFEGWSLPEVGDETVLLGNTANTSRQNAILISASEVGKPRIDVLDGIKNKTLDGCLRTRLGNLDGIIDDSFGDKQPQGDGLYSDNAYLKGEFVLSATGENVATQFEVTSEGIKSAVGTLQNDYEHGKTILYNPSFTKGEDGWITSNAVIYYLLGDSLVYNNGQLVYNNAHENTEPDYNNHRFILNISNGYIRQLNEYFVNKPDIAKANLVPFSLNLKVMVEESGLLLTYLDGVDIDSSKATAFKGEVTEEYWAGSTIAISIPTSATSLTFMNTKADIWVGDEIMIAYINNSYKLFNVTTRKEVGTSLLVSPMDASDPISLSEPVVFIGGETLSVSDDYLQLEYVSRWNGTGNFNLAFGGGASFYSLQLYTNPTEVRYATFFEQSDRLVKFGAQQLNADGTISKESGILTKPEGTEIYAFNAETGAYAQLGVSVEEDGTSKIELTGDNIRLNGNLTANGNFKVREDGSIETRHANINGFVQQGTMYVNDDNYTSFYEDTSAYAWKANITNASPILILEHSVPTTTASINLVLPSIDEISTSSGNTRRELLEYVRGFIGCSIMIYNYTTKTIYLDYYAQSGGDKQLNHFVNSGNFVKMNCKLGYIEGQNGLSGEFIYWEQEVTGTAISMAD